MEHNNSPVQGVTRGILFDGTHNATNELNKWTEVRKDTSNHCDRKILMIKALAEHPSLHDDIESMILETRKYCFICATFARMHIIGPKSSRSECLRYLDAMRLIERGRDDFEPLLTRFGTQSTQFADSAVDDRSECLVGHDDAAAKRSVVLS
jgi:hypothetical protein